MRLSKIQPLSGDMRPVYLISGRIQNSTGMTLNSVTVGIFVESADKDREPYDEADVRIDGPIPDGTRGFLRKIQILPPRGKRWTFRAYVIDASPESEK